MKSYPIVPAFSPWTNSGSELLQNLPPVKTIAPKTVLLTQNRKPTFVRLIRTGLVKLTYLNENGDELLLSLRSEGWWAGAGLALLDIPSIYSVTTVSPCSISSIPVDAFLQQLLQNQRLLRHFITTQCRELLMEQTHGIMRGASAIERLEYLEEEQVNSLWATIDPNSRMRKQEIAQLLSISPEHLSRLLNGRLNRRKGPRTSPADRLAERKE